MNLMLRLVGGLSSRVLAIVLALAAAQFPVYYNDYANTLAGARHEAQARFQELVREASALQMEVEEFIARHETNADPVFQASGRIHRTTLERFRRYSAMESALQGAIAWEKPLVLARNFDRDLASAMHFEPGLALTAEAAAYAFAGLLVAWAISALLGALVRALRPSYSTTS